MKGRNKRRNFFVENSSGAVSTSPKYKYIDKVERVSSNCTHGTSTFNVILNYALKHTFQLRGMASTLCMCTTVSPRQWQSWPLLGLKKDGIAVGLISGRNGVSKTLYSRGACKANWFKRQLHRRQVVAVGWETQNSSPMACVWRWDQKKRLVYSNGPKRIFETQI